MPIIRNPFRNRDENVRPTTALSVDTNPASARPSFDLTKEEKKTTEYKLGEINDSGVCLPPSPGEERKTFWGHTGSSRSTATTSSTHRSLLSENEPFNISRESFDSYRRSFDISGRSPILGPNEGRPRASLDSRTFQTLPRSSNTFARPPPVPVVPSTKEEDFEDVGLEDPKPVLHTQPKKRGLFARLTDSNNESQATAGAEGNKKEGSWHSFSGRKRGQSGQGAELGSMPQPHRPETPKPESHLRSSETPKPIAAVPAPAAVVENAQAPSTATPSLKTNETS